MAEPQAISLNAVVVNDRRRLTDIASPWREALHTRLRIADYSITGAAGGVPRCNTIAALINI
ncbi:hypothetical protein ACVIU7_005373 [Bradyrhizobium liaoningense]|uniref:hypothetical protein n=1 Tax=Bradyrhizobium sp. USDA 241 TaxID=3377725 RepID=UPI003C770FE3